MWKPEIISMVLSASVAIITIFTFFQGRMTQTEKRLTILEEKDKQTEKILEEYKIRLDNHDKQNEMMLIMTEKLANLTDKVDELSTDIKALRKETK